MNLYAMIRQGCVQLHLVPTPFIFGTKKPNMQMIAADSAGLANNFEDVIPILTAPLLG